jgi:translation initiation factor 2B subunit (eIF-2B alpha/beta/delta family)
MSVPEPVAAAMKAIETDLVSGADDPREVTDLMRVSAASLARVRPAMSAIGNATAEAYRRLSATLGSAGSPRAAGREVLATYLRELDRAFAETVRQAAAIIPEDGTVLTTSLSRTVLDALAAAGPARVVVAESRPAYEGRETARLLAEAGLDVVLVSDAAAPGKVREVNLVLIGADAVLADGAVVNKVGSYGIALAAREASVPVYAACETLKISPMHTMPPEMHDGSELWDSPPGGVAVVNPYFELVAADLLTGIVTERGVVEASEAANIAAAKRAALRAIGAS